jgi:hypothetical protein
MAAADAHAKPWAWHPPHFLRWPAFARPLGALLIIVKSLRRSLAPTLLAYLATFVLVAW